MNKKDKMNKNKIKNPISKRRHPVLSRGTPAYKILGFGSEEEAQEAGMYDSAGPFALKGDRLSLRRKFGLKPKADYEYVEMAKNREEFGNVLTPGEPPEETEKRLEKERLFQGAQLKEEPFENQLQEGQIRGKTWYKPWTWLNGGNKSNTKKRKTRKHKTRKHKTRKHKSRKHKTRKYTQKRK